MFAPVIGAWQSICGFMHNVLMLGIGGVIGFAIGYLVAKFS
jgi:uncharacterized membrane protein (Fun14 family)